MSRMLRLRSRTTTLHDEGMDRASYVHPYASVVEFELPLRVVLYCMQRAPTTKLSAMGIHDRGPSMRAYDRIFVSEDAICYALAEISFYTRNCRSRGESLLCRCRYDRVRQRCLVRHRV
jgi:hypothetical protein